MAVSMARIIYQTLRLDETLPTESMAFSESHPFESYGLLKISAGMDGTRFGLLERSRSGVWLL